MKNSNIIFPPVLRLLDSLPDFIMIGDTRLNKIIYVNEKMERSLGKKREDIIGKNLYELFPKKIAEFRENKSLYVQKTKKPFSFEDERAGKYFLNYYFPIISEKGTVDYVGTITKDITKQRVSEIKYQELIDNMSEGMATLDSQGKFIFINKVIEIRSGISKEEFSKFTIYDIILPEYKEMSKKLFSKILKGEKVKPFEIAYQNKDGMKLYVEINARAIYKDKEIIGIQALTIDITEKKEAEVGYQTIVDNSIQGLGIVQNGEFVFANKSLTDIFGYTQHEFQNFTMDDFMKMVHPDDIDKTLSNYMYRMNGKSNTNRYEIRIKRKDGDYRWIETIASVINYKGKKAIQLATIDNTERIIAQKKLAESEERFRDIITHSDDIFYIHDNKQNLQYVSPQSKKILGYNPSELKIKWTKLSTDNPINKKGFEITKKAIKTGEKQDPYQLEIRRKDGNHIIVQINESPMMDEEGNVTGITGMLSDVTDKVKAEQQILQSRLELQKQRNYLQNVIDSATEIIFTINHDGKIRTWNESAVDATGYSKKEIIGKNIKNIGITNHPEIILNYILDITSGKSNQLNEILLRTKYNMDKYFRVSTSFIRDKKDYVSEILFICKDISGEKKLHEKLIDGSSYLFSDPSSSDMNTLFKHLLSSDYYGLYISRTIDDKFLQHLKEKHTQIISLSDQKEKGLNNTTNIDDIFSHIKNFLDTKDIDKKVILFDRIDYLLMFNSFDTIIKFLYNINDIVRKTKAIFLLYFNQDIADKSQWKLLKMEFSQIPSEQIQDIILSKIEYKILQYIFDMQKQNTRVNYKNIGTRFHLSKVTVKKYIDSLHQRELIYNEKHGRTKYLYMTLKGKNLIDQG